MRFSAKVLCRRFNQIRKQNWSAPTVMSVFIIICMLCIFSLESLGLMNNSQNLSHRIVTPEINIRVINEKSRFEGEKENDSVISIKKNKANVSKNKIVVKEDIIQHQIHEKKKEALNDLLYDAALNQLAYESNNTNVDFFFNTEDKYERNNCEVELLIYDI